MKLSNTEIRKALAKGYLIIEPAPRPQDISATGVDLRLGPVLYVLERGKTYRFNSRKESIQDFWAREGRRIDLRTNDAGDGEKGYWLQPQEIALGMTLEHVKLPKDTKRVLQGGIWGRSRTAREFIDVHKCAPQIKPGTDNCVTVELQNCSTNVETLLYFGKPMFHLCFEDVKGKVADFHSDFHGQTEAPGTKAQVKGSKAPRAERLSSGRKSGERRTAKRAK